MRIIKRRTLKEFWERHADSEEVLKAWFAEVKNADWDSTADVKQQYSSASFRPDNRVVFNIKGNNYRLVVKVSYAAKIVLIRFIGTHAEYDDIDVDTI